VRTSPGTSRRPRRDGSSGHPHPRRPTYDLHQGDLVVDEDAVALGARLLASVAIVWSHRRDPSRTRWDRMSTADVDWDALHAEAVRMTTLAYAPYSEYRVGVAGLVEDGRIVSGCNVENAGYGVTLCAECGMVSQLHATGGACVTAVYCVDGRGQALMPCGRCRQLLWENGGAAVPAHDPARVLPMERDPAAGVRPEHLAQRT
jgi:cytidine deaminase